MRFENYLLVTDVDGTLADGQYINEHNIEALKRFMSDGGRFAIATGRSPQSAVPIAKRIGGDSLMIANNGTLVYDYLNDNIIWQQELKCTDAVIKILEQYPTSGAMFYCGREIQVVRNSPQLTRLIEAEDLQTTSDPKNMINKVIFAAESEIIDEIDAFCKAELTDINGRVVRSDDTYIEILPKTADKGIAMVKLSERIGIPREKIFAVGNYYNDVTMLDFATISGVPEESPEEVKEHADYIACDCRSGTVADFVYFLYATVK